MLALCAGVLCTPAASFHVTGGPQRIILDISSDNAGGWSITTRPAPSILERSPIGPQAVPLGSSDLLRGGGNVAFWRR